MRLRNDEGGYGALAVLLHWLTAALVFGLFGLGLWMTGLDYYHPWYHRAPEIHKGIGALLFALLLARLLWRRVSPPPAPLPNHTPLERRAAHALHRLLYLLLGAVIACGYLISTAEGAPLAPFGWFELPAVIAYGERQAELAGDAHLLLASALVGLALAHTLAALKHHFVDRDRTLLRILGR